MCRTWNPSCPISRCTGRALLTLFVQVARRVQYSFRLAAANALDVSRICRLVGGMPLAIQLAASWVALLSPAEIAAEIAADLHFLSTSRRDVPERHRSLAAVIEPSWRRLSPAEQDAFGAALRVSRRVHAGRMPRR